ncbi:glycoside hydrolase family 3 N-terminal domain-containing protein [Endothiovibrio diazotrophicus]
MRPYPAAVATWGVAAANLILLFWAVHLKNPHLLTIRSYETPLLVAVGVVLFAAVRRIEGGRVTKGVLRGAALAVVAITLTGEAWYRYQAWEVMRFEPQIARHIGARFVAGYRSFEQIEPLVRRGLVAGVFISGRNVAGRGSGALRREIAALQAVRKSAGLPPLLIATDQEGGAVSRLSPPLERSPSLGEVVKGARDEREAAELARTYGERQAASLAELGVNVNFSPVVDLKSGEAPSPLDFHSRIEQRSPGADPRRVARVAEAYARGLLAYGVRPTFKHFPGLGGIAGDTHHFSATVTRSRARLAAREWLPFRRATTIDGALIMLSHVRLPAIDPSGPVSLSRKAVALLRGEWGFNGTLITDDLTMAAVYDRGICGATERALAAGVDLLLVAYDYEQIYPALHCAARAAATASIASSL